MNLTEDLVSAPLELLRGLVVVRSVDHLVLYQFVLGLLERLLER